jgi:hypothetical protein
MAACKCPQSRTRAGTRASESLLRPEDMDMKHDKSPEAAPDVDLANEEAVLASEELKTPELPPEVVPGTEELVAWDEHPNVDGSAAPKVTPEDENNVEDLVLGGVDEADREQRIAATDPDYEP